MPVPCIDGDDSVIAPVECRLDDLSSYIRTMWITLYNKKLASFGKPATYKSGVTWDGGISKMGRRSKPIWPKASALVINESLDPLVLVAAQFEYMVGDDFPWPTILLSGTGMDRYRLHESKSGDEESGRLRSQKTSAAMKLMHVAPMFADRADALVYTLSSTDIALSPLYKHCAASRHGIKWLADKWKRPALFQYVITPSAGRVWAGELPFGFPSEVEAYKKELLESTRR